MPAVHATPWGRSRRARAATTSQSRRRSPGPASSGLPRKSRMAQPDRILPSMRGPRALSSRAIFESPSLARARAALQALAYPAPPGGASGARAGQWWTSWPATGRPTSDRRSPGPRRHASGRARAAGCGAGALCPGRAGWPG
jgi:hypothetical protein